MTYKPGGGLGVSKERVLERCTIAELVDELDIRHFKHITPELERCTIAELVDELCRRDVIMIETHKHETYVVAHGNASSYFGSGKATILVVKE